MNGSRNHIGKDDFRRYLNNRMTDAERNAFERELQKHPFEAEALEGFQQVRDADLDNDLLEISAKIPVKRSRNNIRYLTVAATFLVLISTGVLLFRLTEKPPTQQVAETVVESGKENNGGLSELPQEFKKPELVENKLSAVQNISQKATSKAKGEQIVSISEKAEESAAELTVSENTSSGQVVEMNEVETEIAPAAKTEVSVPEPVGVDQSLNGSDASSKQALVKVKAAKDKKGSGTKKTVRINGRVISQDDNQPLPGVTIVEKGTSNGTVSDEKGNFILNLKNSKNSDLVASFIGMEEKELHVKNDTAVVFSLEPSPVALDETVVVGYGVSHETQASEEVNNARPQMGMSNFRKYLEEKAVLPEDYSANKVVVKVKLRIGPAGNIVSVENMNRADAVVFERARQLLVDGPAWSPKTVSSNPVESELTLRLVFRKEK